MDAGNDGILVLQMGRFGGDKTQHDLLAVCHIFQRLKTAGALVIKFQIERIDIFLCEQERCDGRIAALTCPGGVIVAAADMGGDGQPLRAVFQCQIIHIENRFAYPVFIKPSNAGSSRGVSKASDREELIAGLKEAAHHDRKILVEETIVGREIECAVFGNGTEPVIASGVGEILAAADFYDFDAKYYNAESRTVVNPEK